MPLRITTEPLSAADRRALERLATPERIRLLGPAFLVFVGVAAGLDAFRVIGSAATLPAFIYLVGGIIAGVIGLFLLIGRWYSARWNRQSQAACVGALQRGVAEVMTLDADAAWAALAVDEDVPAVLLRCDPQTFLYLNTSALERVITEHNGDDEIPSTLTLRRTPGPEAQLLSITGADRPLSVRTDLSTSPADEAAVHMHLYSLGPDVISLSSDQLPTSWRDVVLRASEGAGA